MDGYSTLNIRRASVMAAVALANETLPNGIPYISEPLGEALIMCLKRVPEKLIIAAILKDAYIMNRITDKKIEKAFGRITLRIIQNNLEMHDQLFLENPKWRLDENVYGYELNRMKRVICWAASAHAGQKRKESNVPFIIHPLGASTHLGLLRLPQTVIEGCVLHDTLEDTETTRQQISDLFGQEVLEIVEYCTEPDKKLSWVDRKQHTIEKATGASLLIKLVICADKLNNLQATYDQLRSLDPKDYRQAKVWANFNEGYEWQKWYYQEITKALFTHVPNNDLQPIFGTLMRLVEKVFGQLVIKDKFVRALVASR